MNCVWLIKFILAKYIFYKQSKGLTLLLFKTIMSHVLIIIVVVVRAFLETITA